MGSGQGEDGTSAHPTLLVLQRRSVQLFCASQLLSGLGFSLLRATVAWHIWKLTGSYALLGTLGLIEFIPVIPFSLLAGALADTADRKRIVVTTLSSAGLLSGVLAHAAHAEERELTAILGTAFLLAVASAFQRPAYMALLPRLVPTSLFPSATVLNANVRNSALMSGPVLMGVVTRAGGVGAAYVLCGLLFASGALCLSRLAPEGRAAPRARVSWSAVREGVAFVRAQPVILGSMVLDMFAVIFAGAVALLPVFADQILGVGELGYGMLAAAMQAGTLLMALCLLIAPPLVRPGRALLWSVVFYGLATLVFGLSRSFALSLVALVAAGMADQVSMTARSIIVQLSTPDELRGRVSSVNMIFIGASNELGAAESGYLAALTSATFSVVFGGCACLLVVAATAAFVPSLRGYRVGAAQRTN